MENSPHFTLNTKSLLSLAPILAHVAFSHLVGELLFWHAANANAASIELVRHAMGRFFVRGAWYVSRGR
jgi:hypothetical protein